MNAPESDDREAYLVYADWLSERGDPRGELITVQIRREDAPDDKALRKAEQQLLLDHGRAWLGDLAHADKDDFGVVWRWGFIHSARLGATAPFVVGKADAVFMLDKLMRLPHIDLCRELVIGSHDFPDDGPMWSRHIAKLAELGVPRGLRRLEITRGGFWDISGTDLGDLSPLYPRLRTLEELRLEMGELELGAIDLPALKKLEIVTGGLTGANLASINAAAWPALETLSLCIGQTGEWGCDVTPDDLVPIYAGVRMPRVKHLALANASFADLFVLDLTSSLILPRLETLDLSRGMLSDDGARRILARWDMFAHLKRLDLSKSFMSRDVVRELAARGSHVIVDDQRQGPRYVTIGE